MGALVAGSDKPEPPPVHVSVVAVYASLENRKEKDFGPDTAGIESAVADLAFDTYRKVKTALLRAPFREETRLPLTPKYTLCVEPLSRGKTGQVRLNIRVTMPPRKKGQKPIAVIATTVVTGPGKQFKLRGLKHGRGELVVVLSLEPGAEGAEAA